MLRVQLAKEVTSQNNTYRQNSLQAIRFQEADSFQQARHRFDPDRSVHAGSVNVDKDWNYQLHETVNYGGL